MGGNLPRNITFTPWCCQATASGQLPCAHKNNLEDRYTNIKLVLREGRKVEVDLLQQGFAVLPLSAVLDSANSRLSELLLGTTIC
jgi:hypothetical protein